MTVSCFLGSTPEPAAVTVNNNTVNVTIASTAATWVVDVFDVADSVGGLGIDFYLSQQAAIATEVQAFIGNVPQEPNGVSFSVGDTREKVHLMAALQSDTSLVVRYLALLPADSTWVNEVLRLQDSTSQAGKVFTLSVAPSTPVATYAHVLVDGVLLTDTTDYVISGATLTLDDTKLITGVEQLVVTYAH